SPPRPLPSAGSRRNHSMRRIVWIASLATIVLVGGIVFFKPLATPAEAPAGSTKNPAKQPASPQLPISPVVLYSSGVGYFQREGEVDGDARIDLSFPVQDVNDLLKSMVLQDLNGGKISAASYDSHDPIDKTLGTFAVNLTGSPSFAQLLHQARG